MKKHGQIGKLESVEIHSINGDGNIMTGQEWYDRFEKEAYDVPYDHTNEAVELMDGLLEAARKAAGL